MTSHLDTPFQLMKIRTATSMSILAGGAQTLIHAIFSVLPERRFMNLSGIEQELQQYKRTYWSAFGGGFNRGGNPADLSSCQHMTLATSYWWSMFVRWEMGGMFNPVGRPMCTYVVQDYK